MAKCKDRTGETNIAKNGMKMTIIAYRRNNDIDIQFEDKIIIYNKRYEYFKTGEIAHPTKKRINRTGETNIANNGMKMTIIAYRNANDIDIQFEDETIVYNRCYDKFKNGGIRHPTLNKINKIGKTNIANNGMKMTIIACRKANDIDIQFEDGTIVYNKRYNAFMDGRIKHPTLYEINRTGETNIAKNGMKMTIIAYRRNDDIDIQFEDKIIVYNKRYEDFKIGEIAHPTKNYFKINNIKLIRFAYKERISDNEYIWHYICKHPEWNEPRILSVPEIYAYDNTAETTA